MSGQGVSMWVSGLYAISAGISNGVYGLTVPLSIQALSKYKGPAEGWNEMRIKDPPNFVDSGATIVTKVDARAFYTVMLIKKERMSE